MDSGIMVGQDEFIIGKVSFMYPSIVDNNDQLGKSSSLSFRSLACSAIKMTSESGISKAAAMPAKNRIPGFFRPDVNILEILDLERPARSASIACDHPRHLVSSRIHVAKSVVMLPAFWVCQSSGHQQPVFLRLRHS